MFLNKIWNDERLWGVIGKIFLLLSLAGFLFGIIYKIVPTEDPPALLTSVFISKFKYPAELESKFTEFKGSHNHDAYSGLLSKELNAEFGLTKYQISSIAYILRDYFTESWPWESIFTVLPKYEGYAIFVIKNASKAQVENVVIDLPFANGTTQILQEGSEVETKYFKGAINLGIIRPNRSVVVKIWSEQEFSGYHEKEIQVTHKTGISSISFARQTFTVFNAFKVHFDNLWFVILEVLIFALLFLFGAFFMAGRWYGRMKLFSTINNCLPTCSYLPENCPIKKRSPVDDKEFSENSGEE